MILRMSGETVRIDGVDWRLESNKMTSIYHPSTDAERNVGVTNVLVRGSH